MTQVTREASATGSGAEIGDIGDIDRFASRAHFASWNGTAPIDASSGDQNRHRLSRAGNRRINRAPHRHQPAQNAIKDRQGIGTSIERSERYGASAVRVHTKCAEGVAVLRHRQCGPL
ncbi:transposase [Amorphoplanes digitatis]|nr:IS110 family transposase [Actinoplanes digitatis]BFE76126.1 hypothetical protein GCM10020092_094270 [Actinoplanes digitatis]GID96545.1 hypothetical protein Adi01nite_59570 [Actinoplanes digitatis]